jgi:hypothetical protein
MQGFSVRFQPDGWHISDGRVDFGPYSSREKAADSAAELTRQMAQRERGGASSAGRQARADTG